jgi:hypothetical protein
MPADGDVSVPTRARFPFVCDGGCQSEGGSHPVGSVRYSMYDSARIDPRPSRGGASQPWAQYCALCFDVRAGPDVQEFVNELLWEDAAPAGAAVQGDGSDGQPAAAAAATEQAAERGAEQLDGQGEKDWGLADDPPPRSSRVAASQEQREFALVRSSLRAGACRSVCAVLTGSVQSSCYSRLMLVCSCRPRYVATSRSHWWPQLQRTFHERGASHLVAARPSTQRWKQRAGCSAGCPC